MNKVKVTAGYGSLVAGILMVITQHFGLPISEDLVNYLSGILVMFGGGLLHLAEKPFSK